MQQNYNLDHLSNSSRVWFFTFKRELSAEEASEIERSLHAFVSDWSSHGIQLEAGFQLIDRNYLVIAADEDKKDASGCSIDKLTRFMMEIDNNFKLGMYDRLKILIESNENSFERIHFNDRSNYKTSYTINVLAPTLGDYRSQPKIQLEQLYPC